MQAALQQADIIRKIAESDMTRTICPILMYLSGSGREIRPQNNETNTFLESNYFIQIKLTCQIVQGFPDSFVSGIRRVLTPLEQDQRYATLLIGSGWPTWPEIRIERKLHESEQELFDTFIESLKQEFRKIEYAAKFSLQDTETRNCFMICNTTPTSNVESTTLYQALTIDTLAPTFQKSRPYPYMPNHT